MLRALSVRNIRHSLLFSFRPFQNHFLKNYTPNNTDVKIYLMIDEYANFTNTLLAEYGPAEYRKIVREAGYFKQFFTNLKAMASGSGAGYTAGQINNIPWGRWPAFNS